MQKHVARQLRLTCASLQDRPYARFKKPMAIETALLTALGPPIARLLLKKWLNDAAADLGTPLVDLALKGGLSQLEARDAARKFETVGEHVVQHLLPIFADAQINAEAVIHEIATTLDAQPQALAIATRLDSEGLIAAFRRVRPPSAGLDTPDLDLYDRALPEAVRLLVDAAGELPDEPVLARLIRLEDSIDSVLKTSQSVLTEVRRHYASLGTGSSEAASYEGDYRRALARDLDYVELFGVDVRPESKRQLLSIAYLSLNLESRSSSRSGTAPTVRAETVLDELSSQHGRILLWGHAGSGKSTLFRWIARRASEMRPPSELHAVVEGGPSSSGIPIQLSGELGRRNHPDPYYRKVPFLVRLRETNGDLPRIEELPRLVARELREPPPGWVYNILRSGRAIILIDGVDEISRKEELRASIEAWASEYSECYFLVSTRPRAVESGWLSNLGFREYTLAEMGPADQYEFIRRWYSAVEHSSALTTGVRNSTLAALAQELIDKLPDHPQIAKLTGLPLLCAMICAHYKDCNRDLPEGLVELCGAVTRMLLHRRERESGLNIEEFPEPYRRLGYEQKRRIVQDLAHYMVRNEEAAISRPHAERIVGNALARIPTQSPSDAVVILDSLIVRSGVLRESGQNSVDFLHNSIRDYLAADRFADDGDFGQLAQRAMDVRWQQVIVLAAGSRRPGFATDLIGRLLHNRVLRRHELRTRQVLACTCAAVAVDLTPELTRRVDAVRRQLVPPRSFDDAQAIAAAGDSIISALAHDYGRPAQVSAACVRTLRLIGTGAARRVARGYIPTPHLLVAIELAPLVNPLEIDAIKNNIATTGRIPEVVRAYVSDLTPVTELTNQERLYLDGTAVSDLTPISRMETLKVLSLIGARVSDLSPVSAMTRLETLNLGGTLVTDLSPLRDLHGLKRLYLDVTPVMDLSPLSHLEGLAVLNIAFTKVADLAPLSALPSLHSLYLRGTKVDKAMIDAFRQAHLECNRRIFIQEP